MELFTTTTLKSSASLHTNVTPMIENNPAPSSPLQPLIEALVEFHKTVPPINKTASAQYGKFADLETVLSTVTPHLLKMDWLSRKALSQAAMTTIRSSSLNCSISAGLSSSVDCPWLSQDAEKIHFMTLVVVVLTPEDIAY